MRLLSHSSLSYAALKSRAMSVLLQNNLAFSRYGVEWFFLAQMVSCCDYDRPQKITSQHMHGNMFGCWADPEALLLLKSSTW